MTESGNSKFPGASEAMDLQGEPTAATFLNELAS